MEKYLPRGTRFGHSCCFCGHKLLLCWSASGERGTFLRVLFFTHHLSTFQSEKLFVSGYNCKWYMWNVKNRKLLQMFLMNTREGMVLTSSGLVTVNFKLLISVSDISHEPSKRTIFKNDFQLYRAVYSTLMLLLNMSKSIVAKQGQRNITKYVC